VAKNPNTTDKYIGQRVRMRRMMLGMSQTKLGDALSLSFQQVQKYEQGKNRMGAGRLQHIAHVLQVPVAFLFEGAPGQFEDDGSAESSAFVSDFLATSDGLALTKAYMGIQNAKLRRSIVGLVKQIAGEDKQDKTLGLSLNFPRERFNSDS
jgi:transcriptional regulator with XRE-family HTH domain